VLEKIRYSGDLIKFEASLIVIDLIFSTEALKLEITDNGKGNVLHDKGSFFHRIIPRPVYTVQNPPFALSDERGLNGLKQKTCFFEDH
jgi:hypothetical protein